MALRLLSKLFIIIYLSPKSSFILRSHSLNRIENIINSEWQHIQNAWTSEWRIEMQEGNRYRAVQIYSLHHIAVRGRPIKNIC